LKTCSVKIKLARLPCRCPRALRLLRLNILPRWKTPGWWL
jgi:hypothetical protein